VFRLLTLAVLLFASEDPDRELVRKWRARLAELDQLQADPRVSLSEGSLGDLGRVAFVFEQLGGFSRNLLDRYDKELVYSAVLGQPPEEFERNLRTTDPDDFSLRPVRRSDAGLCLDTTSRLR
jgi:hypothetical protein